MSCEHRSGYSKPSARRRQRAFHGDAGALGEEALLRVTGALIGTGFANRGLFYRARAVLVKRVCWLMHARDEQERLIRMSGLDWTVFKPPCLADGAVMSSVLGTDLPLGLFPKTTVERRAKATVDEVLVPRFTGKTVFLLS